MGTEYPITLEIHTNSGPHKVIISKYKDNCYGAVSDSNKRLYAFGDSESDALTKVAKSVDERYERIMWEYRKLGFNFDE